MAKGGMQTIQDPLAGYKNWAANTAQSNYGNYVQPNLPGLSNYANKNFGQTPQQTLANLDPLSQDVYGAVQGDITGKGGPFTSLKNNLLGSFDAGAQKFTLDPMKEQLIKEGIYSSGAGQGVLSNAGNDLAQKRALLGSQVDTQLLDTAQGLGQNVMSQNQLMGFTDPLQALTTAMGLIQPPGVQDLNNQVYQQPNTFADLLGKIAPAVISALPGIGSIAGASQGITPLQAFGGGTAPYNAPQSGFLGYNPQQYSLSQ